MVDYIIDSATVETLEEELGTDFSLDRLIRCRECIKKDLCCLYRDAKDENGFCKWGRRSRTQYDRKTGMH